MYVADRLPQRLQSAGGASAARRKELAVAVPWEAVGCPHWRADGGESVDLIAGGTFGVLLSFVATRWLANNWNGLPRAEAIHLDGSVLIFAVGLVVSHCFACRTAAGHFLDRRGHLSALQDSSRSIGGSVSTFHAAKSPAYRGDRPYRHPAGGSWFAVQELSASAHFQSGLRHRSRTHHEVRIARKTIRYPGKGHCLPPGLFSSACAVCPESAQPAWSPLRRARARRTTTCSRCQTAFDQFPTSERRSCSHHDPGYFTAMQIPLIRGRFFTDQERLNRDHYTVVSKKFADKFFPGTIQLASMSPPGC